MKTFFFILLISGLSEAKILLKNSWQLKKADLDYTVNFPLKTIHGHNSAAKGKAVCSQEPCEFLIGAEVGLFDSGDGNRDSHMKEVTKEALFPVVTVRGLLPREIKNDTESVDLEVELAGEKVKLNKVPVHFVEKGGELSVEGDFKISLKSFKIKAPSLLGVKIDDEVPIHFKTVWSSI